MKLKFDVILASDLESGDIFYCNPNAELNAFGESAVLTGTDQILIMDDHFDTDEATGDHSVILNGGYVIWFAAGEKVVRLAYYRELIRIIDMVKLGNPDMQIGPNDIGTIVDDMKTADPSYNVDLIAGLNKDPFEGIMLSDEAQAEFDKEFNDGIDDEEDNKKDDDLDGDQDPDDDYLPF